MSDFHTPVLLTEVIKIFDPKSGDIFIDATLGNGGHTIELLKSGAAVWGLDADPVNLALAEDRIKNLGLSVNFHPLNLNFSHLAEVRSQVDRPIKGILFDLGLSVNQQKAQNRGFSFNDSKSLDMRLNPDGELTAEEIVNTYDFDGLSNIFSKYSQETLSRPIATEIIRRRQQHPIKTASDLADIIRSVYRQHQIKTTIDPATKVFLALRIVVNNEFANLNSALLETLNFNSETIVTVIAFHSGEDRSVKNFIRQHPVTALIPKAIRPSTFEVTSNPLSRSAILRSYRIN